MIPILRKELRSLLPIWALGTFLISGDLLTRPLYQRLDELSWLDVAAIEAGGAGLMTFLFGVVALVVAYSAFPREHDERTIEHLYALPVSRSEIFLGKIAAGLVVCGSIVCLGSTTDWILQSQNTQTFAVDQWRAGIAATELLLRLAYVWTAYAYGILASYLRRFGLVLVALGLIAVGQLDLVEVAPMHLLDYEYSGAEMILPWGEVAWHLGAAAACLGLAGWLWMARSEGIGAWFRQSAESRSGRWVLRLGTGTLVTAGSIAYFVTPDPEPSPFDAAERGANQLARAETAHVTIFYPSNLRARALDLIARADSDWEYLMDLLGADHYDGLMVDLGDRSRDHAGIASWGKARMTLEDLGAARARFVLVHELSHIAQHRVSDRRLPEHYGSTRFFTEGMADWVAYDRVPDPRARETERLHAAILHDRQHIPFEVLSNERALRQLTHPRAAYSLGELFTEALVRSCGRAAPRRVLEAFADPDAPKGLSGSTLWQTRLQAIDCELESVLQKQSELIQEISRASHSRIESIPRISGGITGRTDDDGVAFSASLDRPPGDISSFALALRTGPEEADDDYVMLRGTLDPMDPLTVHFELSSDELPADRFEFAFGVWLGSLPLFESWKNGRAP